MASARRASDLFATAREDSRTPRRNDTSHFSYHSTSLFQYRLHSYLTEQHVGTSYRATDETGRAPKAKAEIDPTLAKRQIHA